MAEMPEGTPNGKACPVCHTPVEAWARICPRCEHEWPVTPDEVEEHALQDFQGTLRTLTPRFWVTPLLMGLNLVVFGAMVVAGVHFLSPTSESLVRWGADFGPLTSNGQWWRLVSATFLHVGIIHLAFNMYVLWDIGGLVERLVGNAAFLALYLLAGVFGSLASLIWNPLVVSAGASGAVFGRFGLLRAFVVPPRRCISPGVLGGFARGRVAGAALRPSGGNEGPWGDPARGPCGGRGDPGRDCAASAFGQFEGGGCAIAQPGNGIGPV